MIIGGILRDDKVIIPRGDTVVQVKDRVVIFDTTLRDGEQSPGASLNVDEKVVIAHQLEKLGVDIIEAGFPIASPGDFEGVKRVAENLKDSGYETVGFFSAPYLHPSFGFAQGFDSYQDCTSYSKLSVDLLKSNRFIKDKIDEHGLIDQGLMSGAHQDITNPIILGDVKKWLDERTGGPCCRLMAGTV